MQQVSTHQNDWPFRDTIKPAGQNNGNGDGTMDDRFATKEELKTLETKMDGRFDTMMAKMDGQFNTMNARMDGKFETLNQSILSIGQSTTEKIATVNQSVDNLKESVPDKISIAITKEFKERDKDRKETNRFIIGTLVIGGLSLIASIAAIVITLIQG